MTKPILQTLLLCAGALALSACTYQDGARGRYVRVDAPIESVHTEHKSVRVVAPPGTTIVYGEAQGYPYPPPRYQHRRAYNAHGLIRTYGGQCLDIDQSRANRRLITYACHGRDNQQFIFDGDRLRVSGLCLDVAGENRNAGAEVIAYRCNGQINQAWYYDGRSIRSAMDGFCLDAGKQGNRVHMYPCDGTAGQQFFR